MANRKKSLAFAAFQFSDPDWDATVIPVAGEDRWAVVMAQEDRAITRAAGRTRMRYGRVLAVYKSRGWAQRLAAELMDSRARMLAQAYP